MVVMAKGEGNTRSGRELKTLSSRTTHNNWETCLHIDRPTCYITTVVTHVNLYPMSMAYR